jgi:hypothetical protein
MLMQLTLGLILAGTVGLAELVTRQRDRVSRPELQQIAMVNQVQVKLPAGWVIVHDADDPNILVARESSDEGHGRTLKVRLKHTRRVQSAEEYLQSSGLLRGTVVIGEDGEPIDPTEVEGPQAPMRTITMAGRPGVMARVLRPQQSMPGMPAILRSQFIAVTILPPRTAIILQLDSAEPDTDGLDADLIQRVAAGMDVEETDVQNQPTVSLPIAPAN